jgi:hypothetical protein
MRITTFLLALFLVTNSLVANTFSEITTDPVMPQLSNLNVCDDNYDGIAVFDLTVQNPIILAAQSGASVNYAINYYLTQTDAISGFNAISSPNSFVNMNNQQVIYVRITLNGTIQYAIGTFALMVNPLVTPTFTTSSSLCQGMGVILPGVSTNNIAGSWFPPSVDTSVSGATVYMFTPYAGQCASPVTMTIFVTPSPSLSNFPTLMKVCDDDSQPNDQYTTFNLADYFVNYYGYSFAFYLDASHSNPITNPNAFVNTTPANQTIFISVTDTTSGCVSYGTLTLQVLPIPTPHTDPYPISVCDANNDGIEVVDLTINAPYILNGDTNVFLHYFHNLNDIFTNTNEILTPTIANVTGNVWIKVESNYFINSNNNSCYSVVQQPIQINPSPMIDGIGYSIVDNFGIQTLTVQTTGSGNYSYFLDGGASQISPIFQNIALGNHSITVTDLMYGCTTIISNINVNLTATPPPTGSSLQTFNAGATLASLQVTGQNTKWYSGLNKNVTSTALPLSTILIDGTTYYASQTIGGYESTTRLPVTVHIALSTEQFELKGLTYAPNPVSTNLSIKSDDMIDSYSIYNLLGQLVVSKKCTSNSIQIDVTSLNSGNYFVKLTSENKQSTIKIERR